MNYDLFLPLGSGGIAGKIFATMLLHFVIALNFKCKMTMFWKSWFLTFDPITQGSWEEGVCWHNICYYVTAFCDCLLFDMQHDYVLKKLNYDPLTPSSMVMGGGGNICYHVAAFVIFFFILNITMSLKSWILTYSPGSELGVWGQNICYHAAAFMILFNLIYNMTMFWKMWTLTYWPHFNGRLWGSAGKIFRLLTPSPG